MADKVLKTFTVEAAAQGFKLTIEGEDGQGLELMATREQIDVIADTLDDLLAEDDSADEVGGDEDDEDFDDDDEYSDDDEDDEDEADRDRVPARKP